MLLHSCCYIFILWVEWFLHNSKRSSKSLENEFTKLFHKRKRKAFILFSHSLDLARWPNQPPPRFRRPKRALPLLSLGLAKLAHARPLPGPAHRPARAPAVAVDALGRTLRRWRMGLSPAVSYLSPWRKETFLFHATAVIQAIVPAPSLRRAPPRLFKPSPGPLRSLVLPLHLSLRPKWVLTQRRPNRPPTRSSTLLSLLPRLPLLRRWVRVEFSSVLYPQCVKWWPESRV
jgi:hypothetical protein